MKNSFVLFLSLFFHFFLLFSF